MNSLELTTLVYPSRLFLWLLSHQEHTPSVHEILFKRKYSKGDKLPSIRLFWLRHLPSIAYFNEWWSINQLTRGGKESITKLDFIQISGELIDAGKNSASGGKRYWSALNPQLKMWEIFLDEILINLPSVNF